MKLRAFKKPRTDSLPFTLQQIGAEIYSIAHNLWLALHKTITLTNLKDCLLFKTKHFLWFVAKKSASLYNTYDCGGMPSFVIWRPSLGGQAKSATQKRALESIYFFKLRTIPETPEKRGETDKNLIIISKNPLPFSGGRLSEN